MRLGEKPLHEMTEEETIEAIQILRAERETMLQEYKKKAASNPKEPKAPRKPREKSAHDSFLTDLLNSED